VTTLAQVNALVDGRIRDTPGKLSAGDVDACTTTAAAHHSKNRPRRVYQEYTAGSDTDTFALPTSWDDGISVISSIEEPVGKVPQVYRDPNTYCIAYDKDNDAERIRFDGDITSGDVFVVEYTAAHDVSSDPITLADSEVEALADLGAHFACLRLASFYADSSDSGLGAGAVDTEAMTVRYNEQADRFLNAYERFMGIASSPGAAASTAATGAPAFAVRDYDPLTGWGRKRIFHSGSSV